jgi:hypothetical protein
MATVTPNFNWPVPTSTDLVKDGATAIEALGDSIDGSLVDLKGGTTGQVLSKTSGTDMDFTWVTTDDANAIQNSIVDAKGDLITATAADTPARLAVGTNGQTLVADSSTATGLAWTTPTSGGGMTVIASGSLPTGTGVLTLSSISQDYKNLQLVLRDYSPISDAALYMNLNNDSSSNVYKTNQSTGANATATSQSEQNTRMFFSTLYNIDGADYRNALTANFYDYTNTTANKLGDYVNGFVETAGAIYVTVRGMFMYDAATPAAITRIDLTLSTGNYRSGTYILYGVK